MENDIFRLKLVIAGFVCLMFILVVHALNNLIPEYAIAWGDTNE